MARTIPRTSPSAPSWASQVASGDVALAPRQVLDLPGVDQHHLEPGVLEEVVERLPIVETADGTIWVPGDSRLIPEHHLGMPAPDAMLFDFSDSEWHFGLDGAIAMANVYPQTPLLLQHWGCVDAPDFPPFNADPASLPGRVDNPDRIVELAPGEPFTLKPLAG